MGRHALLPSLVLALALAACGNGKSAPAPAAGPASAPAVAATPADPKLASLYAQTCAACHGKPGTGAPQAGNVTDWQPRVAQGLDVLVQHAVSGYKGMPPLGSCADCTEDDYRALIRFMANLK